MNNLRIYASTSHGGLYRSENNGNKWELLNTDFLPFVAVAYIGVGPKPNAQAYNPIFLATGSADGYAYMSGQTTTTFGIYRSMDDGVTWEYIDNHNDYMNHFSNLGGTARKILVSPQDANQVYVATTAGVFRSVNAMSSSPNWELTLPSTPSQSMQYPFDGFRGLALHPNNPSIVYASGKDVYISVSGGATGSWNTLNDAGGNSLNDIVMGNTSLYQYSNNSATVDIHIESINIAVTTANGFQQDVYAYVILGQDYPTANWYAKARRLAIFRYDGINWNLLHTRIQTSSGLPGSSDASAYYTITPVRMPIAVAPNILPNEITPAVYFGTTVVFKCSNIGTTISTTEVANYNGTGTHADYQALEIHPLYPDYLFAGEDGGVSKKDIAISGTGGWTSLYKGLENSKHLNFDDSEFDEEFVLTGLQDVGNWETDHSSLNGWRRLSGGDGYGTAINDNDRDDRYYQINSEAYTLNHISSGTIPSNRYPGMPPAVPTVLVNEPITTNPNIEKNIYMALAQEVYMCKKTSIMNVNNANNDWELCSDLQDYSLGVPTTAVKFRISENNPNVMYILTSSADFGQAGYYEPFLFKSTTGGVKGQNDPNSNNFVNISNNLRDAIFGVGATTPLPIMSSITLSTEDDQHIWVCFPTLYTTTNVRVWESLDGGATWINSDPNGDLPNLPALDIAYQSGSKGRVFVATEAGVYVKEPGTNDWCKFGNIPNVRVTEIKLNMCTGKIRAATFGRGIWEADLPPVDLLDGEVTLIADAVWTGGISLKKNLRIQTGATLTLDNSCILNMPQNGLIIVEKGARLVVNGGTITNNCGRMWHGIVVEGDENASQLTPGAQGELSFTDARIEHARNACMMWSAHTQTLGGDSQDPAAPFKYHVSAWAVDGITFTRCHFENARSQNPAFAEELGGGIYTIDAGFKVRGECDLSPAPGTNPPCPTDHILPSTFRGLYRGVFAMKESQPRTFTVHGARFENNITGILSQGVDFPSVLQNRFTVGGNPYPVKTGDPIHEGIVINTGSGYRIEENELQTQACPGCELHWTVGTRIANTGAAANQVYKNSYAGFYVAELANGNNLNVSFPATGAKFLCNSHTEDFADIAVVQNGNASDGIAGVQIGLNSKAAGNTFSQNGNFAAGDLYNDSPWGIKYHYFQNASNETPIYYFGVSLVQSIQNECPSNVTHGLGNGQGDLTSLKSAFGGAENNYNALYYTYHQLIDGGNTNQLIQNIEATWSDDAWELRSELLARSPYLSEDAIKKAAEGGVLPQAMLMEVLLANPDLLRNGRLLDFLQEGIPNPLSAYTIEILVSASQTETARTVLETALASQQVSMAQIGGTLIRTWLNDSVQVPIDTVHAWLERMHTLPTHYALAQSQLCSENIVNALQTLNAIPTLFSLNDEEMIEHGYFTDLLNMHIAVKENDRDMHQLTQSEKEILQGIASQSDKLAGVWANNTLCFHYGACKDYPAQLPQGASQQRKISTGTSQISDAGTIQAYPNPANAYVNIDFELFTLADAVITVYDVSGSPVTDWKVNQKKGTLFWDSRGVADGFYLYELKSNNQKVAIGKIFIQH